MKKLLLAVLVTSLALVGCATTSNPTVEIVASPEVTLGERETFAYMPYLGTDKNDRHRSDFSNRLIRGTSGIFSRAGLNMDRNPDILVDFRLFKPGDITVAKDAEGNTTVRHPNWSRSYKAWPEYQDSLDKYKENDLLVMVLDPKANMLMGEGAAFMRANATIDSSGLPQRDASMVLSRVYSEMIKEVESR